MSCSLHAIKRKNGPLELERLFIYFVNDYKDSIDTGVWIELDIMSGDAYVSNDYVRSKHPERRYLTIIPIQSGHGGYDDAVDR